MVFFLSLLLLGTSLSPLTVSSLPFALAQNPQVAEIDSKLKELKEMKRGYESRALRHENYAEYLQFEDQAYLETRRHLELAEENRQKAAKVQQQIDILEARREQLLKR